MNVEKLRYWKQSFQESRWDFSNFPLGKKKASMKKIIGFIVVVLVVILLVFLMKNGWNMQEATQDIMGLFGSGKK